jgi:acyl-CoA reductase-like NAD-dependent aldehyde dehydrogenase
VETTPGYVSRTLVRDAETAVHRAEARLDGAPAPPALERARRLADWAARATEEQDHLRAIQRAYYAIQLVENR